MTIVLRRVRRRPPIEKDPIKRGRRSNFLSDNQVEDIRMRKAQGETALSIAKDYHIGESAICKIANNVTYKEPAYDSGYKYNFTNRLTR
jgi:DNA invertase Pin-like site-specific DNA recombinase